MLSKQANRLINARNWAVLVKPEQIVRENDPADTMYGKFVCEPLERGYGTTIGNALRRVLLASLQGAAFVSVKIAGVQHEFTTIPGVLEDVTDIILNIKQVRLAMDTDVPQTITLNVNKKGEVTVQICPECGRLKILITNLIKKDAADTESNQIGLRSVRKMVEMHQGELYTFVETNIYTVGIVFDMIHKYSG